MLAEVLNSASAVNARDGLADNSVPDHSAANRPPTLLLVYAPIHAATFCGKIEAWQPLTIPSANASRYQPASPNGSSPWLKPRGPAQAVSLSIS